MSIRLLILAVMMPILCAASSWDNNTGELRGKRLLVFKGYGKGFVHNNIDANVNMFIELAKEHRFAVDTTSLMEVFNDKDLKKYDMVAFANASYLDFDSLQRAAFQRFVRRGAGVVALHAASCMSGTWDWYIRLIGGWFDYHPASQRLRVNVIDAAHPSTKALPKSFMIEDELYTFKRLNPSLRILAVFDYKGVDWGKRVANNTFDGCHPAIWCHEFEGARVWFSALGHYPEEYSNREFRTHVIDAMRWVTAK